MPRNHRSDDDRELHNHPWENSTSLILWGGYREERLDADGTVRVRTYRPWSINRIGANDFHRVELLDPRGCLTLFIAGKRQQSWGFKDPITGEYEDSGDRDVRVEAERQMALG